MSDFEALANQAAANDAKAEVSELKLTVEGLKEELRQLGVAFECLQDAVVKAALSLKAFNDAVPQDHAEIIANYLESAAGKAT